MNIHIHIHVNVSFQQRKQTWPAVCSPSFSVGGQSQKSQNKQTEISPSEAIFHKQGKGILKQILITVGRTIVLTSTFLH